MPRLPPGPNEKLTSELWASEMALSSPRVAASAASVRANVASR